MLRRSLLLAWLVAILGILAPSIASAATTANLETRVKAFELVVPTLVGRSTARTPEKHPEKSNAYDEIASGSPLAAEGAAGGGGGITTLFHGTDAASAEQIVAKGINKAAAQALGGGDVFWATTDPGVASLYAQSNPVGGPAAVVAQEIPTSALQSLLKSGAVAVDRTGAYMVQNWTAFNRAVVSRSIVR